MPTSFLKIFSELEAAVAAGVLRRSAVGGVIAATFYLEATETEDVDVFVVVDDAAAGPLAPLAGVYEWFRGRGAQWQDEHLVVGGWPLQLLPSTGALVDEALEQAARMDVEGQPVNVLRLEHLAAIALETNRPKNRVRLAQMWNDEPFDRARFTALVERFGLGVRWKGLHTLMEGDA